MVLPDAQGSAGITQMAAVDADNNTKRMGTNTQKLWADGGDIHPRGDRVCWRRQVA